MNIIVREMKKTIASNLAAAAPRRGIRIAAARHIPEPVMRLYRRRASLGKS